MATEVKRVYSIEVEGADSINELKNAIEQLNEKLKTLNETSKEYKDTLEQLTELQGKLANAMSGIADNAEKTSDSIGSIKESIEEVGDVVSEVSEGLDNFGNIDTGVVEAFVEGFVEGMNEASQSVEEVSKELEDLGNANFDGLKETIGGVKESLDEVITATTETETSFEKLGNASSVKELKDQISELRDRLVTLKNDSKEYQDTVNELIDKQVKLKEVMNAGKNETQAAEGSYNALSQRMSALKQVWKEVTDEATRNEIGKQINEINNQLKALDASIGNSQRNVGNYKSALEGLDDSFIGWKQELKECKEAMQQLDPSTQAYADAMARAAELTHQMSDQQEMIKYSSSDLGDQLSNIKGIASNLAAGYSALNAAMGLFGEENEDVQQAMLKVQQAMALVQGLQGIDGFIKRTKGLSQSMGLVTKATQANTVATKANATAAKADAAAMAAETVATKAAVPAQLSLNAAMKANPIGFIVGLIATLVTAFTLLKDKIMEMIGANKDMSAAFDKVKAVLAGFGNIIKKSVINPIKMAIIPIKTLAKVMIDMFKGDWSKIGDDIKEGFTEMKDTVVDTINVVGAFKEGYDKKTAEQDEAARKARAAERQKELDNIIKDNEAKYGSDWKYTKDAQKVYQQMFKARESMYDKDSDEYKESVRERLEYDREYNEKQSEFAKSAAKAELDYKKALYGDEYEWSDEWHQKVLEGLDEATKSYNKALKDYNDAEKKFIEDVAKQMGFDPNDPNLTIMVDMQLANPEVVESLKQAKETLENTEKEVKIYEKRLDDYNKSQAKKRLAAYKSTLNDIKSNFEKFVPDVMREQWNFDDIIKKWENSIKIYKGYLKNTRKLTDEQIEEVVNDIRKKLVKSTDDAMVKALSGDMEKSLSQIEKNCNTIINEINTRFENKKILEGIKFPDEEIQHSKDVFVGSANVINKELEIVRDNINKIYEEFTKEGGRYFGMSKEQLANELPEFQKLIDKETELKTKQDKLFIQHFTEVSDIYAKDWKNRIDIVQKGNEAINDIAEQNFKEQINNAIRWQGVYENAIRDLYEDKDYLNETYKEQKGQLERLRDMYLEMAQDERLTFEEKENAKREAAKVTGEIIQLEYDKEAESLRIQKGLIKEWTNAWKDAASNIGSILGSVSDYYTGLMELEKTRIDQMVESGEIDEKQAEARYAQQRKNFENAKKLQIAETWINGFSAAIGAYQSMASIPYVGPVLGAAAAAAALALAGVNASKIQATSFENPYGGSGGGGSSSTNFQLPNVMELEPNMGRNLTGMDDTDNINNDGSGRGRGETAIKAYVVESDVTASQELANKRKNEVTF